MLTRDQLIQFSDAELATQDVAAVHLACAEGLPGAEQPDARYCLSVLDAWAAHVGDETVRCTHQFQRDPAAFENSWAYFRILLMTTVLQEDCGVHYNPDLVARDDFFADAANLFLHGVAQGKGGTCSSLPPLYVAVGRRLGYPLNLVQTNSHLFARWDEPRHGERFNVECTSRGLVCHPDDYYMQWPVTSTAEEIRRSGWLVSLGPRAELAWFLACRGHCLYDNCRYREAADAYASAAIQSPRAAGYASCLEAALLREPMAGIRQ